MPFQGQSDCLVIVCPGNGSVAFVSNAHAQNPETSEGRIIIAVNTDWGVGYFTDANGKLLFKKQFEEVDAFIVGLAKVAINGKYGFINTLGEVVIPCEYDDADHFSEGLATVRINGKYGYINKSAELVIPCIYDNKWGSFYNGLCQVKEGEICKVINTQGKVIIPQCSYYHTSWSFVE